MENQRLNYLELLWDDDFVLNGGPNSGNHNPGQGWGPGKPAVSVSLKTNPTAYMSARAVNKNPQLAAKYMISEAERTQALIRDSQEFFDSVTKILFDNPKAVSKEKKAAIEIYTSSTYDAINSALEKQEFPRIKNFEKDNIMFSDGKSLINTIDSTFTFKFDKETTIMRGDSGEALNKLKVGTIIEYKKYVSCSTTRWSAKNFTHSDTNSPIFHIKVPATQKISIPEVFKIAEFSRGSAFPDFTKYQPTSECEVMLPRNTSIRITKISGQDVYAEIV